MPKWMFWAGVLSSALLALVTLGWGAGALMHPLNHLPGSESWLAERGAVFGTAALILTWPLAALMLRMAARLASRRLFDAVITVFAVTGASIVMLGTAVLMTGVTGQEGSALPAAGLAMTAVFAALSMLSLKSYFEIQSSRTLSLLVMAPLPLAVTLVGNLLWTGNDLESLRRLFGALALTCAGSFAGIAVHAARHRHMFVEPTGLRGLLARRREDQDGQGPIGLSGEPLANS